MNLSVGNGSASELLQRDDPEGRLLQRSLTEPAAFGDFYDITHVMVLRFFYSRTACSTTAADLCAETFAAALEGIRRFDPDLGTGRAWLTGIAKNLLRQYIRREDVSRRARERMGVPLSVHDADLDRIDMLVDFRPLVAGLAAALTTLPEPTRDAVVLRIVDEMDYDQIADRLGISPGNARVRVCRGLHRLGELLEVPDE
jgi:RNA polymerase sigma-70 factor (ECF subfamily)